MKKLGWLAGSTVLLWAALLYPAWLFLGDEVWLPSLSALVICLIPALATMVWMLKSANAPEKQLVAVLGSSGIRMGVALGCGLLLYKTFPLTFTDSFWFWIAVFY